MAVIASSASCASAITWQDFQPGLASGFRRSPQPIAALHDQPRPAYSASPLLPGGACHAVHAVLEAQHQLPVLLQDALIGVAACLRWLCAGWMGRQQLPVAALHARGTCSHALAEQAC